MGNINHLFKYKEILEKAYRFSGVEHLNLTCVKTSVNGRETNSLRAYNWRI